MSFSSSTSTTRGVLGLRAFAHRLAFQHHAFGLDGFDEFHEGVGADDAYVFFDTSRVHFAEAASECLFRQNVAFGGVGAEADDSRDVANVPAFLEHHDGDDRLVGALHAVDRVSLAAKFFQFFLALAGCGFGDFAVVFRVDDQDGALQVGIVCLRGMRRRRRNSWCRRS